MSILKTPEDEFINELEGYLDMVFDDYGKGRIIGYLKKYRKSLPPVMLKNESNIVVNIVKSNLPIPTQQDIINEAKKICLKYEIDYSQFIKKGSLKGRKTTSHVADARKELCKVMIENYNIRRKQLQEFLLVDHSTIIYYLSGKRYQRKKSA